MLDPHFDAMLKAEAAAAPPDAPALETLPPEILRAFYREQRRGQNLATSPAEVVARDLEVAGAAGPIAARLYTPPGFLPPGPCLVYFHGGGWVIGDLETHDAHCRRLALHSAALVLAVDYRLAPEHPFPAGHDDAMAAARWAFDHAGEIGANPARIGVGGDSAGGNLAAATAIALRGDPRRRLKFQLLLYPATWPNAQTTSRRERDGPVLTRAVMDWFERTLAALGHPEERRAMPARADDLAGLPPALVITAGHDPLEHEGRDYALALQAAGVEARWVNYDTLVHDFFIMGDVSPAVAEAARETGAAVKAAL
ncbi:MAG: alpha/beta hydrolase [Caulobacteraceae bacterium]|nr:alpha/beta hydrolase [Caulobacteraceae bacterium]